MRLVISPSPEKRGLEKQQLIMPDRLKEGIVSSSKEGLKVAFLSFHLHNKA